MEQEAIKGETLFSPIFLADMDFFFQTENLPCTCAEMVLFSSNLVRGAGAQGHF